jgi:RNA polymerase sigma-70 factor (ECF subfamily)
MRSDDELLTAWRQGDTRSGRELFERHYEAVDRFFRSKVGDDAGDLAQRTFLGCLESVEADRYESRDSFRSWLFAIAYRQLCKFYRESSRDREHLDFNTVSARDLAPTPGSILAKSEQERLLLAALREIPLDMQVALELHYWEQMSDAEIARTLGQPLGTIKSRIRRARQVLADKLAELASSPELLNTTLANLEGWAKQLRERVLND